MFKTLCSFVECKNDEKSYVVLDKFEPTLLSPMNKFARASLYVDNAGGKSEISEAWSIHHLMTVLQATTCIFEMDIVYWYKSKMVDYIITVPDEKKDVTRIGVSVTRAMCRPDREFSREDAIYLLNKKIHGLIVSRSTVVDEQCFYQSILHVWAPSYEIGKMLYDVIHSDDLDFSGMDIMGTLDVWITVSEYAPIYTNGL